MATSAPFTYWNLCNLFRGSQQVPKMYHVWWHKSGSVPEDSPCCQLHHYHWQFAVLPHTQISIQLLCLDNLCFVIQGLLFLFDSFMCNKSHPNNVCLCSSFKSQYGVGQLQAKKQFGVLRSRLRWSAIIDHLLFCKSDTASGQRTVVQSNRHQVSSSSFHQWTRFQQVIWVPYVALNWWDQTQNPTETHPCFSSSFLRALIRFLLTSKSLFPHLDADLYSTFIREVKCLKNSPILFKGYLDADNCSQQS